MGCHLVRRRFGCSWPVVILYKRSVVNVVHVRSYGLVTCAPAVLLLDFIIAVQHCCII